MKGFFIIFCVYILEILNERRSFQMAHNSLFRWAVRYFLMFNFLSKRPLTINKFALLWGEAQLCLPYVCLSQCSAADCVLIFFGAAACTAPKFYIFTEANMCVLSLVQCAAQHRHQTILMWYTMFWAGAYSLQELSSLGRLSSARRSPWWIFERQAYQYTNCRLR